MSIYYSKYDLNTWRTTPYFSKNLPPDYPLSKVLQKCKAFRRLPPHLRELSEKAKQWDARVNGPPPSDQGINQYYDSEGYELDPSTGHRLTDAEVDETWVPQPDLSTFVVQDIPMPPGGFPDPNTWEEPAREGTTPDDDDSPTRENVERDIQERGYDAALEEYGVNTMRRLGIGA